MNKCNECRATWEFESINDDLVCPNCGCEEFKTLLTVKDVEVGHAFSIEQKSIFTHLKTKDGIIDLNTFSLVPITTINNDTVVYEPAPINDMISCFISEYC